MKAIYRSLRGIDPITGEADAAGRSKRLDELDKAAQECVELTPWRDYTLRVKHAEFVNQSLIASKNAVVNAFAFYIRGRRAGVSKHKLDEVIARWVFATLLTARYSGSSETVFEQDLTRVEDTSAGNGEAFVRALDDAMSETTQAITGPAHSWRTWRLRRDERRRHWLSEPPKWSSEQGRSSATSSCRTCSTRRLRAAVLLVKPTICFRRPTSIGTGSGTVGR